MTTDITLINRLFAEDSQSGKDSWYTTVIPNCIYKIDTLKIQPQDKTSGSQTVYAILIPFGNFKPYEDWKINQKDYTISIGDKIIIGKYKNPQNISKQNMLTVQGYTIMEQKYGVKYQLQIKAVG